MNPLKVSWGSTIPQPPFTSFVLKVPMWPHILRHENYPVVLELFPKLLGIFTLSLAPNSARSMFETIPMRHLALVLSWQYILSSNYPPPRCPYDYYMVGYKSYSIPIQDPLGSGWLYPIVSSLYGWLHPSISQLHPRCGTLYIYIPIKSPPNITQLHFTTLFAPFVSIYHRKSLCLLITPP